MKIELPPAARLLIDRLEQKGFEAWIVGGCVRDCLLGRVPHDFDICTAAKPEQTIACFAPEFHVVKTGLQHGTVTVVVDGEPYEITTYRVDGAYSDSRHPDEVSFVTDLREDLGRRDFTINAMAYHPVRGLADYFGGAEDLATGVIRCVGDPAERFGEDALRILRALRFASTFDFAVEAQTAQAMHAGKQRLREISAERIQAELGRFLCGPGVFSQLIAFADVLCVPIPEIAPMIGFAQRNPHHQYDVWTHTAASVQAIRPVPALRLAMLLHDIGKPSSFTLDKRGIGHFYGHPPRSAAMAAQILRRLKFDNATAKTVETLVLHHDDVIEPNPRQVKRWLRRVGETVFRQMLEVRRADIAAQSGLRRAEKYRRIDQAEAVLESVLAEGQCFCLGDLAVDGRDLMAAGIPQGKRIGEALDWLLAQVVDEALPNEREALLQAVRGFAGGAARPDGREAPQ